MKKVIGIGAAVALLVGAGGYSMVWYSQANEAKNKVEQALAKINAQQPYVSYQALQTSGFPNNVYVEIVNPSVSGRIDTLLKQLIASPEAQKDIPQEWANAINNLPQWEEKASLNGTIRLGIDRTSNHVTLNWQGETLFEGTLGEKKINTKSSPAIGNCALDVALNSGFGQMWDFDALHVNGDAFMQAFRKLECSAPGSKMTDATSGELLIDAGPTVILFETQPVGTTRTARLVVKGDGTTATEAFDRLVKTYYSTLLPNQPMPTSLVFASLGKQVIDVEMSYNGPASPEGFTPNTAFSVDVNRLNISNAIYQSTNEMHISNAPAADQADARLMLKANTQFGASYNDWAKNTIHQMIQDLYAETSPADQEFRAMIQRFTPEQLYAIALPVMPDFVSLGHATYGLDLTYKGSVNDFAGEANLANLEIAFKPYGLKAVGNAKKSKEALLPSGNFKLDCSNCNTLIDDAAAYARRVQTAISYFDPAAGAAQLEQPLVDAFKQFLASIADAPKADAPAGTMSFTFQSDGGSNMTLGGKNMMEVMMQFEQTMRPVLAPQQAPAQ